MTKKETKQICIEYSFWKNRKTEYRGNGMYNITEAKLQLDMKEYVASEEDLFDYFIKHVYN